MGSRQNMQKVKIRCQKLSDAKRFFEILNNPNFIFWDNKPKTLQDEIKFIKSGPKRKKQKGEHDYTILFDNKIVGGCGVTIGAKRGFIGEIGYFIDEAYWGNGIASTAVKLLEKIGFGRFKLQRIEILMMLDNIASEKVAIKCGYKKEGIMKKALKHGNDFVDCYLYAKTK